MNPPPNKTTKRVKAWIVLNQRDNEPWAVRPLVPRDNENNLNNPSCGVFEKKKSAIWYKNVCWSDLKERRKQKVIEVTITYTIPRPKKK